MATQIVELIAFSSTTVVRAYNNKSDTIVQTASAVVQETNRKSIWLATFTDLPADVYRFEGYNAANTSTTIMWARLTLTNNTFPAFEYAEQLTSASGDASQATLLEIQTFIEDSYVAHLATLSIQIGAISLFPTTLMIGDSYTSVTQQIRVDITDSIGGALTGIGSLLFADATITFAAFRHGDSAQIVGTCVFTDAGATTYVMISITAIQTAKGKAEYTYEGRLKFVWAGGVQKTYSTTPFKFVTNP